MDLAHDSAKLLPMTTTLVIKQIKALPPRERRKAHAAKEMKVTSILLANVAGTADFCTDRLRGWDVRSARVLLSETT